MFKLLYDFFYDNVFSGWSVSSFPNKQDAITIFGTNLSLNQYFSLISSLIALAFIVILCCLFVYKIIKLIGGLIR